LNGCVYQEEFYVPENINPFSKHVFRFLLDNGANPNSLACCGASALHFSSESGNLPIVQELVEYGHAR
jgi:ankyrin repeat protein